MSRSLAFVGILTIIGAGGTWSAYGQDATDQTTQGQVVSNHMTDAERDRLMEEAMEAARLELEKKKAQQQADKVNTERVKAEEQKKAAAAADAKKKAAADQKAREERLAQELAEAEKNASTKQAEAKSDAKDLDSLEPLKEEKAAEKKTATASSSSGSSKPSSAGSSKKSSETANKSEKSASVAKSNSSDDSEQQTKPEKAVVKTVSTKQPGAGISVKTSMPVGDEARKAEQAAAAAGYTARSSSHSSGGDMSLSGRVVGIMRGTGGPPRILVNGDDHRMVQVVLEQGGIEVPPPGTYVSIKGRDVSGGAGRLVISAASLSVRGEESRSPAVAQPEAPQVAVAPPPMPGPLGPPALPGPPPPMIGGMPPPMPMMGGPVIMGGPPPMF